MPRARRFKNSKTGSEELKRSIGGIGARERDRARTKRQRKFQEIQRDNLNIENMIVVQKRKSTCSQANDNNNNIADVKTAIGFNGTAPATSQQQTAVKSSRKRTKLVPTRSQSASLVNQRPNGTDKALTNHLTKDHYLHQHNQQQHSHIMEGASGQTSDESVWIFGLINNIEQLLSTFTAINTKPTSSCNNSGTSTPTSLSSSFSFCSSSASSSNSSSSSTTPSRSTSASSSPSSANSPSSISNSPSSFSGPLPPVQPAPPAAATAANLSSLPRSPISRQIKFHEYKGPPSAKRQQQQQQNVKLQQTQEPISSLATGSQAVIGSKNCCKSAKTSLNNRVPVTTTTTTNNNNNNHISQRNKLPAETEQAQQLAIRPAARTALGSIRAQAAAATQQPIHRPDLQGDSSQLPLSLQQQRQTGARQVLSFQHQMACAHSMPVQRQQQQLQVAAQNQLTSGPRCANLQTFYINQPNTLGNSVNGPTLLSAPFIGAINKQHSLVDAPHNHQLARHQSPQLPLLMEIRPGGRSGGGGGGDGTSSSDSSCSSSSNIREQSCNVFSSVPRMVPNQAGIQIRALPLANSANGSRESEQYHQLASDVKQEGSAREPPVGLSQECSYPVQQLQPFNQQQELCSQLDYDSLRDDLTTFGPDSEDTDACEIEPSMSFSHGVEELLFSEFIDLQDIPMNVDESDWLKKFLPPCSMG